MLLNIIFHNHELIFTFSQESLAGINPLMDTLSIYLSVLGSYLSTGFVIFPKSIPTLNDCSYFLSQFLNVHCIFQVLNCCMNYFK